MMEAALKTIIELGGAGRRLTVLCIFNNTTPEQGEFRVGLANAAAAADVPCLMLMARGMVQVGNCLVMLRTAHCNIDRELRGLEFAGIWGLECVDQFEHGVGIAANLQAQVRS